MAGGKKNIGKSGVEPVQPSGRRRGRPAAFDRAAILAQAMVLFWERGYEGASFNALTEAMGISASSLQNTFGSKEALFQDVVRYYTEGPGTWFAEALGASVTTRETFERLLAEAAAGFTNPKFPVGCLVSLGAIQTAPDLDPVRMFMKQARQASQDALAARIRHGIAQGDVPADTDPDVLGAYFGAVFRGMAILARDGTSREKLHAIGMISMRAWPELAGKPAG